MIRYLLIIMFYIFSAGLCSAQDTLDIQDSSDLKASLIDSTDVNVRLDTAAFARFLADEDLVYPEELEEESMFDEIWKEFLVWFYKFISEATSGGILSWIIIGLMVAFVVFIFLRISDKNTGFYKDQEVRGKVTLEDNIEEINFDSLVSNAEKKQDYNEAIRYLFLNMLKILINNEMIRWKPAKTNTDYYYELEDPQLREQYKKLSLIFDYADYSDYNFDSNNYNIAKKKFDAFINKLKVAHEE